MLVSICAIPEKHTSAQAEWSVTERGDSWSFCSCSAFCPPVESGTGRADAGDVSISLNGNEQTCCTVSMYSHEQGLYLRFVLYGVRDS